MDSLEMEFDCRKKFCKKNPTGISITGSIKNIETKYLTETGESK